MFQIIAIKSELEFTALFTQPVFWAEELNTHKMDIAKVITEYFGFIGKLVTINYTKFNGHSTKTNGNKRHSDNKLSISFLTVLPEEFKSPKIKQCICNV